MAYAEGTAVAFEKSIAEIIGLVKKHGGSSIGQMEMPDYFALQFVIADRLIRFRLPLPDLGEIPTRDGNNRTLTDAQRSDRLEQRHRQRGRALLLVLKAKLESVESGIETVEQAFLANVVMADGSTVYDRVAQPIRVEYQTGKPNVMLLEAGGRP